ncbi:MAG: hypothetical protein ACRDK5_00620, partial [Solirubrobacterales bacterium]
KSLCGHELILVAPATATCGVASSAFGKSTFQSVKRFERLRAWSVDGRVTPPPARWAQLGSNQ